MRKRKIVKQLRTVGLHAIIAGIAFTFAFPLMWMFMMSFKAPREYYRMPPKFLPDKFHLFHYKEAFAPWMIDPTELSESTYWIEKSAGGFSRHSGDRPFLYLLNLDRISFCR